MELTKRQKDILYAIVTEFIETALPVGSNLISEKYDIEASPATIRYEMVRLADEGFIAKSHTSSGRIPTVLGYRFFIKDLMSEETIHYLTEIRMSRELSTLRFQREKLIRGMTSLLADISKYASVVVTEDGIYYSGLYNLLDYPEFEEKAAFKNILLAFDDLNTLTNVFSRHFTDNRVKVIIGDELESSILSDCSIVFTEINLFNNERAVLAIVGPKRMNFSSIIPLVRYASEVVEKLILGWEK